MLGLQLQGLARSFYPEKLPAREWLGFYAQKFPTVEINATFYRLPKREMIESWAERTPPEFLFAVKGSRYTTHISRLSKPENVKRFWEPLEPLRKAGKLGPILWQLPPNFERDDERLENFLAKLPKGTHCFEFRHASWFKPAVRELLESHGASLVVAHDARSDLPGQALRSGRLCPLSLRRQGPRRQLLEGGAEGMGAEDRRLAIPPRGLRVLQR